MAFKNKNSEDRRKSWESPWQRFWRKRRMNALRNSSDHAMYMAITLVFIVLVLGGLVYLGVSEAGGPTPSSGGLELFNR